MPERTPQEFWVDWYLRDELTAEDEAAFEAALLESPQLQQELEAALALRAALERGGERQAGTETADQARQGRQGRASWRPLALAATVVLAVLSTLTWWKAGSDSADLERQLQAMAEPRTTVLTVPVPIMRSAGGETPDVIVQKPAGHAAILLDIELGLRARQLEQPVFDLVDAEGATVLSWRSSPTANGRATALINSEQIPASRLWLHISDGEGKVLDRRLLEFRVPPKP